MPINHLGDMRALFDQIPLGTMNTSMTINATAAWLMALYIAVADEQGAPRTALTGTIQNDIIKEYLSRGTYVFPPAPSMRLIKDVAIFTTTELPKWNPMNICSYHLQEAGATPVQELAFALATAVAVLDTVKASGEVSQTKNSAKWSDAFRFSSMPGCASSPKSARCAPSPNCGTKSPATRYGITDPKQRLFRYGVQVNSLGLTEPQPENNVARILIEMLAVTLVEERARPRRAIAGLERSARPAAAVGSAMVAAHAADPGLRDRPARLRRYFRRLDGDHRARSTRSRPRRSTNSSASRTWAARSPRSKAAT